jgi:hypothetical protein
MEQIQKIVVNHESCIFELLLPLYKGFDFFQITIEASLQYSIVWKWPTLSLAAVYLIRSTHSLFMKPISFTELFLMKPISHTQSSCISCCLSLTVHILNPTLSVPQTVYLPLSFLGRLSPTHISLFTNVVFLKQLSSLFLRFSLPDTRPTPPSYSHPKLGLWLVALCLKATVMKFFRAASQHKNTPQIQVRSNGEVQ